MCDRLRWRPAKGTFPVFPKYGLETGASRPLQLGTKWMAGYIVT